MNRLFSLSKPTSNATLPRTRTGTVKFDYDASDPNGFSVLAKEVRESNRIQLKISLSIFQTVNIVSDGGGGDDSDWITIEKLSTKQRGRIPRAYIQIDSLSNS